MRSLCVEFGKPGSSSLSDTDVIETLNSCPFLACDRDNLNFSESVLDTSCEIWSSKSENSVDYVVYGVAERVNIY